MSNHNNYNDSTLHADLLKAGAPLPKSERWGEVGMVVFPVAMLGIGIAIMLGLSGVGFKIAGFVSVAIGLVPGLMLRAKLLAMDKKRLAAQHARAATAREEEVQRQLATMRKEKK